MARSVIKLKSIAQVSRLAGSRVEPKTKRKPKPRPTTEPLPPGTLVARLVVEGLAVPWSSADIWNGVPRSKPELKAWKEHVATSAHAAGLGQAAGHPPYEHPVKIGLVLCRKAPRKRLIGKPWAARPDIVNLQKAIEDALSGNVFKVMPKVRKGEKKPGWSSIPPSPIGRILADDNIISRSEVDKIYWHRSCVLVRFEAWGGIGEGFDVE